MQIYLPIAEVSVNGLGLLVIGTMVGLLSGMFGVGGGFILTPLLFFIGIPPAVAVASAANQIAGSFRPDIPPGELMLLADHINFSGKNPLIGEPSDARFVSMTDAYDPALRRALAAAAAAEGLPLAEGVYAWYSGPSFETPAEIRALRVLGADAVGMSTVPEVILARFLGLRVAAVSVMTNMAAGLSAEALSHGHTIAMAPVGAGKLERILRRYLRTLAPGAPGGAATR